MRFFPEQDDGLDADRDALAAHAARVLLRNSDAARVGEAIAALLGLRQQPNGRYSTTAGDKTAAGLARTLIRAYEGTL